MKTVIFREQFGPAESDFLSSIIGFTNNAGRKLFQLTCEEVVSTDAGWLTVTAMFQPDMPPVTIRIPIGLVLLVWSREGERAPPGFVGQTQPVPDIPPIPLPPSSQKPA